MNTKEYLDRLLVRYASTFNLYVPYQLNNRKYDAYGFFESHVEKYVLTRNANLWTQDSYEHCLFLRVDQLTKEILDEMKETVVNIIEPDMVLKGEKYPPENHMYSYMSIILITEKKPDKKILKYIKKQKYEKGYMFNIRGFSNYQLCVVSMEDEAVYYNRAASKKKKLLQSVFSDVYQGKIGFQELWDRGDVTPYEQ